MSEVEEKVVWVVGGSGGIGSNIARRMSDNGWKVIISARNFEKLQEVSQYGSIETLVVDATDADDVQAKAVEISTTGSLKAMILPSLTAIIAPIIVGIISPKALDVLLRILYHYYVGWV